MARLECGPCGRRFLGDLPVGGGLYYPMLLDLETGEVHDRFGVPWFARWLAESYAESVRDERSAERGGAAGPSDPRDETAGLCIESMRPVHRPLLLNCIDRLYGHCVLKLLNAQFHLDHAPDQDLILLIPRFLRWMAPDGVAEIWSVDRPLRSCGRWEPAVDRALHDRLEPFDEAWISTALSHPHPRDVAIARFTRTRPFPVDDWDSRLDRPTITFVWRENRAWTPGGASEASAVTNWAAALRRRWSSLDFAIAGIGRAGGFPAWIADLRVPPAELSPQRESDLCRRYAASHVVVGIHGSNLLLPSAHAGAAVSLTPPDRWRNAMQDVLPQPADARETAFRYRALPSSISPEELAIVVDSMLREMSAFRRRMSAPWALHGGSLESRRDPERRQLVAATAR